MDSKLGDIQPESEADRAKITDRDKVRDSDLLAKIISKLAIDSTPNNNSTIDPIVTISDLIMPTSIDPSFDLDASSIIAQKATPTTNDRLTINAIQVLEDYLMYGETITKTEVITDAQGNMISEKTIVTHRGCPRWAIDAILNWN